ncbi:MAG: diguanylate cyclase [Desulfobacterales bacterium]|nr:diguanylate cyclase [Desulfobacterales bacterium]
MMTPEKILVVDDSLTIRMQVKDLLELNGFDVTLAENGLRCLEILQYEKPDVILLDIIMPEMDGIEVCQKIKIDEKLKYIPILILTTESDIENKVMGLDAGADDYVTKPFELKELMARIKVIIRNLQLQKELRLANKKILEQQKSVIEEERLKVLLQMSGATALELDQPLSSLLGYIDLLNSCKNDMEKLNKCIYKIKSCGKKVSDVTKRIQNINYLDINPKSSGSSIFSYDEKLKLLSVESRDEDFQKIENCLKKSRFDITRVHTITEAIKIIESERMSLIFLDHPPYEGDALDLFKFLAEKSLETPVIVITGQGDEMAASQMIQSGADGYITKDRLNEEVLTITINTALEKYCRKMELKSAMEKLAQMATRDELTGLYNRRYFRESMERETVRAVRYGAELVLCIFDLDHFKKVNDTYGHLTGDMVLSEIGKMLQERIRGSDLLCRYGGEEFAVILPNTDIENAYKVCDRFRIDLSLYDFSYESIKFRMTTSIGIATLKDAEFQSPQELVLRADQALYRAKESGRNKVITYEKNMSTC